MIEAMSGERTARARPTRIRIALGPARAAAVAAAPPAPAAPDEAPQHPVAEEGHDAGHDHDQGLEPDVVVLDVGHLVGDDALELDAVELFEDAGRDADHGRLRLAARGEGVGRRVVDDVALGRGQAGGEGQPLDDVIEVGELVLGDRASLADAEDDLVARVVADRGRAHGDGQGDDEAALAPAGHVLEEPDQDEDEGHEEDDEGGGFPLVARDLFVHGRPRAGTCTLGTCPRQKQGDTYEAYMSPYGIRTGP